MCCAKADFMLFCSFPKNYTQVSSVTSDDFTRGGALVQNLTLKNSKGRNPLLF